MQGTGQKQHDLIPALMTCSESSHRPDAEQGADAYYYSCKYDRIGGEKEKEVLPLEMVDKSTSSLQTHFGPVFCHEAVRTGLLFPERGSIPVLLLAHSPILPRHGTATTSSFGGSQAETGGNG